MLSSWKIHLYTVQINWKLQSSISKAHIKCCTFDLTFSCSFLIHKITNQIICLFSSCNSCTMLKFSHQSWSTEWGFDQHFFILFYRASVKTWPIFLWQSFSCMHSSKERKTMRNYYFAKCIWLNEVIKTIMKISAIHYKKFHFQKSQ